MLDAQLGNRIEVFLTRVAAYPSLQWLASAQLREWPEHVKALERAILNVDPAFSGRINELAALVRRLAGDEIDRYCADYHWMCDRFLEERLHFERTGEYRLQTFDQAYAEVYGQSAYMGRYVNGILLSQVFWRNHAAAIDLFRTDFLPSNRSGFHHLDVGPGHGLFLAYAVRHPKCGSCTGWDVSASSIAATKQALDRMEIGQNVSLVLQDVLQAEAEIDRFDSAIISEVLEHLERPDSALAALRLALTPGGRIFINVPVNSPAPDHIYLWRHPDEITALVERAGFHIDVMHRIPIAGKTVEQAIKGNLDISCVVIAHK